MSYIYRLSLFIVLIGLFLSGGFAAALELVTVPEPPLAKAEEAVRTQLTESRKRLDELRAQSDLAPDQLGEAFGEMGMLYLNYGFLAAAQACFANAHGLRLNDYRWTYYLGVLFQERGQLDAAAERFEQTLTLRSGDLPTVLRLADVLLALNQIERAEVLYQAALQSPVGLAAGHAGLGQIAFDRGDNQDAITHYEAALADQPQADSLHHPLGLAYREIGELDKARSHLELSGNGKVISADPLKLAVDMLARGSGTQVMQGVAAFREGQFEEAATAYRAAIEANPKNLEARRALAATLVELGDDEGAIEQYRALLAADSKQPLVAYSLGNLLLARGDLDGAIEQLRAAVGQQNDFADALLSLGEALGKKGDIAEASRHFERAVELDPRSSQARLRLNRTLRALGQQKVAQEHLETLLELEPHNVEALLLAAQNLIQDGQPQDAQPHLKRAIEEGSATRQQLAQAYFLLGTSEVESREKRIEHYTKAIEYGPRHLKALYNLATELAESARVDEAIEHFKTVVTLDPKDRSARYRLGMLLIQKQELWDALGQFEALRQQQPEHLEFTVRSAHLLTELGDAAAAAQRLKEGLGLAKSPEDKSRLYERLGALSESKGARDEAFVYFRQAVSVAPQFPPARRALADALGRAKLYAEAVSEYDTYLAQQTGDEEAHFARAMALIWSDQHAEAVAALDKSLQAIPTSAMLAHLMARLLATSSEPAVRDGEKALALATQVFQAARDPAHGETVAMSLAVLGRFEEALSWQQRLLTEAEKAGLPEGFTKRVRENLSRYEAGQPALSPW